MSTKYATPTTQQQAAIERVRAMPVQFFWPPAAPKLRLHVTVIVARHA